MAGILAMKRLARLVAATGAVLLAGCSSGSNTVYERLGPLLQERIFGGPVFGDAPPVEAPPELTRAALDEIPFATIALRSGDAPRAFIVPVADNGGYLNYQDVARRGIVMLGGLVTGTHGFGYDLDSVRHAVNDPIVVPTPLAQWPVELARNYSFTLRGQLDYEIAVQCSVERGAREIVEIVERAFEVVRVVETCVNPQRRFVNTYWVDPGSGFIWKSEQWVGPRIPPMTVEIIRPYARS